MFDSTSVITDHALPVRRERVGFIALWGVQVALAGMFLFSGGSKLAGAAAMLALFDAIGIGQWFRYVTGAIEVVSAVALVLLLGAFVVVWARRGQLSRVLSRAL